MRRTKIQIALPQIANYFNNLPEKIFKPRNLFLHFSAHRHEWDLAINTTPNALVKFLMQNSKLQRMDFPFPYRAETRYIWGKVPLLEVLLSVYKDSYFTHHTAMEIHGLCTETSKNIYINHEQSPRPQNGLMEQRNIDTAFRNHPRTSNNVIEINGLTICVVNGMNTNQWGVIEKTISFMGDKNAKINITNIERTLIDIVVRPAYSGGIEAVKNAYQLAKGKFSVKEMHSTLLKLKYVYPYHQAIGYLLKISGYSDKEIKPFKQMPMEYNFYLTHKLKDPTFNEEWKLYVPYQK